MLLIFSMLIYMLLYFWVVLYKYAAYSLKVTGKNVIHAIRRIHGSVKSSIQGRETSAKFIETAMCSVWGCNCLYVCEECIASTAQESVNTRAWWQSPPALVTHRRNIRPHNQVRANKSLCVVWWYEAFFFIVNVFLTQEVKFRYYLPPDTLFPVQHLPHS